MTVQQRLGIPAPNLADEGKMVEGRPVRSDLAGINQFQDNLDDLWREFLHILASGLRIDSIFEL